MHGGAPRSEHPRPFDLVELVRPTAGHEVGERGTVTVEGVGRALVDFSWPDGVQARVREPAVVSVPDRSMRIIERRANAPQLQERRGRR